MDDIKRELFRDIEKAILGGGKQNKSRKSFNLLYTLSNTMFRADEFHEKCDGKGPTLTLLYGRFNNCFGGYTSQDWSCESHRTKRDESAFLFFKNKNAEAECKIFPIPKNSADNAIVCDKKFGPTFGYTKKAMFRYYDLQTCYESGKPMSQEENNKWFTLNGQLHVPYLYKPRSDSEKTSPGGETTGDFNGGTLSVFRMEVYQVI
ncbi:uncharacterized protein LOC132753982, partial [Ruditapes philippinarum]|uniref:uncharacterized protein LOC132753982 n=1 Tax=Ruditapes philippinarum TaxID=129788 RepID=UPI00295A8C13